MPRGDKAQFFPSGPLFQRLKSGGAGAKAKFARTLNISQSRLTNWATRGIPAAELPNVTAALGLSVEAYLREAGREPPAIARQDAPVYLLEHEQQLLERYRKASPRWQLTLRLLAALPSDDQEEVSGSVNVLLAKVAAVPAADRRVEETYGFPPSRQDRLRQDERKPDKIRTGNQKRFTR